MAKNFNVFHVLDVRKLLDAELSENERESYKLRILSKKNSETFIFTKKDFKLYAEEHDVSISGKIRKHQQHYTDYADFYELRKNKAKKNIIGCCNLQVETGADKLKKYDIKQSDNSHTVGYAWVGKNRFIQVTAFNPLLLLIPFLICGVIAAMFSSCPAPDTIPPWADQQPYSDAAPTEPDPGSNFAVVVNREYHVSAEDPAIELKNYIKNEKSISYNVYTESGTYIGSTGLIKPGNKADLNIYSALNTPGEYRLKLNAVSYNEDGSENPIDGNIFTTVIVE